MVKRWSPKPWLRVQVSPLLQKKQKKFYEYKSKIKFYYET
jgi:hypothetical protein